MAVQQRIIGGGLLLAGIAVVLILIFLFSNRGMDPAEAYSRLKDEIYPAYVKADEAGDYVKLQDLAKEAKGIEADTAMAAVLKEANAAAAAGDREARGLLKLLEPTGQGGVDAFDQNLKGLFELDGGWYESRSHTALRLLKRCLLATLDSLRAGSGLEIPLPEADATAKHPVAAADAALFRAFALPPAEVQKALKTKGAGAKANSARLVWNQADATDDRARLSAALEKIPRIADAMERAAVALGKAEQDLKGREDARRQVQQYLKLASDQLAAALDAPARPPGEFPIAEIAAALMQEARILKATGTNAPDLGKALAQAFAP
ncbi:MAG: hypothetical protein L6Q95_12785 [Planctomycetes bacterium]|nr:hypothetical protein [Planctomycetota bacterium]